MNFAPTYSEIATYFKTHPKFNVKVAKVKEIHVAPTSVQAMQLHL